MGLFAIIVLMSPSRKTFIKLVAGSLAIVVAATVVFSITESISLPEGLYRTIYITLSHHDNFHMENWIARITIIVLIVASLLVIAYLLKTLADYMINLGDGLKRNKMKAKLVNINDHYIVCGLGRVGSHIAKELATEGVKFVGIDKNEELVKAAIAKGYTAIVGDSTKEEVLMRAKLDKARGLVAALSDDSSNLFVTLTARQINKQAAFSELSRSDPLEYERQGYNRRYQEDYGEKFNCECGGKYVKRDKGRHGRSKKHLKYLQAQQPPQPTTIIYVTNPFFNITYQGNPPPAPTIPTPNT